MADEKLPQHAHSDELSVEELDQVAGGIDDEETVNESRCTSNSCPNTVVGCGGI
jgi:hypothetical protein